MLISQGGGDAICLLREPDLVKRKSKGKKEALKPLNLKAYFKSPGVTVRTNYHLLGIAPVRIRNPDLPESSISNGTKPTLRKLIPLRTRNNLTTVTI